MPLNTLEAVDCRSVIKALLVEINLCSFFIFVFLSVPCEEKNLVIKQWENLDYIEIGEK